MTKSFQEVMREQMAYDKLRKWEEATVSAKDTEADSTDLAIHLAKLEAEQEAIAKFKIQQMKAQEDLVRAEKARIEAEAEAIKEAQSAAAAEAYGWMQVFTALDKRGMDAPDIMNAIKQMQDMGHPAELCLDMIEKTAEKPKKVKPKEPPRPAAYGTWA